MKLEDLRNGDIVVTRNRKKYIYLKSEEGFNTSFNGKQNSIFYSDGGFELLSNYNSDMTSKNSRNGEWDIVKVYRGAIVGLDDLAIAKRDIIWKRN